MSRHAKAPSLGSSKLLLLTAAIFAAILALGVAVASALAPTVSVNDASNVSFTTASVSGSVDPGEALTTYRFQYSTAADFSGAVNGPQGTLSGSGSQEVSGELTGLSAHTTYYLRLLAENADGKNEAVAASSFETLEAAEPIVDNTFVTDVTDEAATLNAKVNPAGAATTYHFQYVGQGAFEATGFTTATSTPNTPLTGKANPDDLASAALSELEPATSYRYRVIAESAKGTVQGPDRGFHTFAAESNAPDACPNAALRAEQHAAALPDCRAWELVSPTDKNGGDVFVDIQHTHAASDGGAVVFHSLVGFGDVRGTGIDVHYLSQRGGGGNGWTTHAITPPMKPFPGFNLSATGFVGLFNADLSSGIFQAEPPITDAPNVEEVRNLYRIDGLRGGSEETQLLSDAYSPLVPPGGNELFFASMSASAVGASADLSHVVFESKARLTENANPGLTLKLYEYSDGEVRLAGILPNDTAAPSSSAGAEDAQGHFVPQHSVSEDGSRVFFQTPTGEEGGNLYMREDATTTVQLNASERTIPEEPQKARRWAASTDGSRAFFTTNESLLDSDEYPGPDAYMWRAQADGDGHRLTLLSPDTNGNGVAGIVGASDDGRYVYYLDFGGGIYVWHDGTAEYIGGLSEPGDVHFNLGSYLNIDYRVARVSPDGHHLLFWSGGDQNLIGHGGFTGYDHGNCGAFPCQELYVYDAVDGSLQCASCQPSGEAASSEVVRRPSSLGAPAQYLNRSLSDDGRYVFFSTLEALLPEDTNGRIDAYEFDSQSGEVHLLSSGTSPDDSYFLDASPDGKTAFIVTRENLVGWDIDRSRDLYAVRVDGGVAEPTKVTAPCEGESCRVATPAAPAIGATGSTQEGPGNRRGRKPCTAKRAGAKQRCHKHKNKKHAKRTAKNDRRAGK